MGTEDEAAQFVTAAAVAMKRLRSSVHGTGQTKHQRRPTPGPCPQLDAQNGLVTARLPAPVRLPVTFPTRSVMSLP